MNRFITESEVEEVKEKRAKEWEEARAAGRDVPDIDEPVDTRTLYERLKEQKDQKQEEFEEKFKFKNMIYKGLNEDDASFLSFVSKKQAEIDNKRYSEESEELQNYRVAVESTLTNSEMSTITNKEKKKVASDYLVKNQKSQKTLLASLIVKKKRKPKDEGGETSDSKKLKPDENLSVAEKTNSDKLKNNVETETNKSDDGKSNSGSLLQLADYSSSSSDEDNG